MNEAQRRRKAIKAASAAGAEALLVTHLPDVRYLSGFTGSNAAVALTSKRSALFTDGRYKTQAKEESPGLRVVVEHKASVVNAVAWLAASGVTSCAYDPGQTSVSALDKMRAALPRPLRRSFFVAAEGLVARQRELKDEDELKRMRQAAALGCALFEHVLGHFQLGVTEAEIAAQLEFQARMAGAEAMSFETIVASGERSALPHGRAGSARLPRRGFVTLDFGVVLDGYCSDMTRTIHLGKPTQEELDVYHSVLEAQETAVSAVAAGVTCGDVDEAARAVLRRDKLDKFFSHSTGHGVGIEIHEGPRIASKGEQVLEQGMVITVEPGVYLPGKFGVRIEDMVAITKRGAEVLTSASPKGWIEL